MGIFGDDKFQDERIAALEEHVRIITQNQQAGQVALAKARIAILRLESAIDDKVSAADVDPAVVELNEQLGKARVELERSKAAAAEGWSALQAGVNDTFEKLRTSVDDAYDKVKKD